MEHVKMIFDDFSFFDIDSILITANGQKYKVVKFYSNTWWRRFLVKLGFENNIGWCKLVRVL